MTAIASNRRLDALLKKSFAQRVSDLPSAIQIAQKVINRCALNYDDYHQAYANCYLGYYYMILSDTTQSEYYTQKALSYFEKNHIDDGMAMCYYTLGSTLYKTDNYHKALKYLLESHALFIQSEDLFGQSRALKAIASIYELFQDYQKAEQTYHKCIEVSKLNNDDNGISNAYNPLSGIYLKNGKIDLAEKTIKKSIELKKETKDKRGLGYGYYGLGKVELAKSNYNTAEKLFLKGKEIHSEMGDQIGQMMAFNKLGILYFRTNNIGQAKIALHESLKIGKVSRHFLLLYKAYHVLYEIAKSEGRSEDALEYLEGYTEYKTQVEKKETKNVISSIKSLSEMEMIEKEAIWQKAINENIEKKNKELDTFVYKVAHDLRGPISSLMGLYNIVEHDISDEKPMEYFGIYNKEINRLNTIVLDFINVTQIKEKKLEKKRINFNGILADIIDSYRFMENFDNLEFSIKVDAALEMYSDESTITTIVQNLIENAIKYSKTDETGKVNIKIYGRKRDMVIQVHDTGIGIEEHNQPKIFDMFFRAHNNSKGTGLGLFLLKSAVEKLSGKISFESFPEIGTTFKIVLPY
ncbi:tetratricopeptide repeat-containing sensor histidine kinase [Reichenbachiella ulvae]|uniref:histidine kinase n=1 Tax=Reichenbachiella ulvae TaxID=2980104 RepID=A0ABT3CPL7_9BACT|nr:tetratricopeptide repeat-containing sensor histidine kinase [Reichenbachiella ulvae]MCV9385589.1 tetratricopeptide repeat-containing sensor histidine kinase [Reichenbachiella ulvae]